MSDPERSTHRAGLPAWMVQSLKLAFGGALLWVLFTRIDIGRFWAVARASSPDWLALGVAAYAFVVAAATWRWRQLLRLQGIRLPFRALLESTAVALFFNNFLPSNIGGDVMRIRDTAGAAGSAERATAVVVVDRVTGLVGLVLVAAISSAFAGDRLPFSPVVIWCALAAGCIGAVVALRLPAILTAPLARLQGTRVGTLLDRLLGVVGRFGTAPAGLVECVAISVAVQLANVGVYLAVARALHLPIAALDVALIVPLVSLIQAVPISFNGIGLREAAFTVLFGRAGVSSESALLLSLEATAVVLAFSLLGGLVYLLRPSTATSPDMTTSHAALAQAPQSAERVAALGN